MYIPAHTVPVWLGALGWAAAAASLGAAAFRLRRNPPPALAFVGAAALVAALRLLEFPLGEGVSFGASVLAAAFAVVVFGAEVGTCALAAATVAHGAVALHADWAAVGANLLVHATALPWAMGAVYVGLKRTFRSRAAGYVLAFALGAAGAPAVALAAGAVAWAGGALVPGAAARLFAAGLALTAAEGALAAWGYTLAASPQYRADGRASEWAPRPWPGAFGLAVLALAVAAGVAPFVPAYGGALGLMPAWARAPGPSWGGRALAGGATAAGAAVFSLIVYAAAAALRPRRRPEKTPAQGRRRTL